MYKRQVDDDALDALDVLEGVDEGMYARVRLQRVLDASPGEPEPEPADVDAFGYVAGAESIARGVGDESCEPIPAYDLETHEAAYVPKARRAAGSLGTKGARR